MRTQALIPTASVVLALVSGACAGDAPTRPVAATRADATARSGTSACAAATTTVSDEASLHAAIATAQPGDVIAIAGIILLHRGADMETPGLTLTCAAPGAGLAFAVGEPLEDDGALIYAIADNSAILGLTLDATGGVYGIYSAFNDGQRTIGNTIRCGAGACGFWPSVTHAIVTDNIATAPGNVASGFHFQMDITGSRIERNTLIALGPAGAPVFGAIRPRDGTDVILADNVILGPWSNGISSVNLNGSQFLRNSIEGPQQYGLVLNINGSANLVFSTNNTAVANRVRDAGIAGFLLRNACDNTFRGNPSLGSTPVAFQLDASTGANIVEGTAGASIDDGAYDCDGDGVVDPNRVSGKVSSSTPGAPLPGVHASSAVRSGDPASPLTARRLIQMQ